jgi:hypothetical protein
MITKLSEYGRYSPTVTFKNEKMTIEMEERIFQIKVLIRFYRSFQFCHLIYMKRQNYHSTFD